MTPPVPRDRIYRWRPFIGFEDTNLVGNVYFARFVSWQGRCREAFLADYAPGILSALADDLRLVTLNVSCAFFEELRAFDSVEIGMRLEKLAGHRIAMRFDYRLERDGHWSLAAQGAQEVACMQDSGNGGLIPTAPPAELASALLLYAGA